MNHEIAEKIFKKERNDFILHKEELERYESDVIFKIT